MSWSPSRRTPCRSRRPICKWMIIYQQQAHQAGIMMVLSSALSVVDNRAQSAYHPWASNTTVSWLKKKLPQAPIPSPRLIDRFDLLAPFNHIYILTCGNRIKPLAQEVDNNNNNQLFFEEASTPDDPLTAPIGGNLAQANSIPATPTLTTPAPGPASDNAPHQYFCCSAQVVRARFKDETCEEMRDVNTLVKNDGTTSPCENLVYDCPSEGVVGFIMKNCAFVQKKKTNPPNVIDHLACKILGTCWDELVYYCLYVHMYLWA